MKKRIAIFVGLLLVFVIATAPASLINHFFPANSAISFVDIKGTLWSGRLKDVTFKKIELGQVNYSTSILSLITGKVGAHLELSEGDIEGALSVKLKDTNNLWIKEGNLTARAFVLESFLPVSGIQLNGNLETSDFSMTIEAGKPKSITGVTRWLGASLNWNGQNWQLGDFALAWTTDETSGDIVGKISNAVNKLGLRGQIKLSANGMLEFTGSIAQTTEKPIYDTFSLFADGKPASGRLPLKFRKKIF